MIYTEKNIHNTLMIPFAFSFSDSRSCILFLDSSSAFLRSFTVIKKYSKMHYIDQKNINECKQMSKHLTPACLGKSKEISKHLLTFSNGSHRLFVPFFCFFENVMFLLYKKKVKGHLNRWPLNVKVQVWYTGHPTIIIIYLHLNLQFLQ